MTAYIIVAMFWPGYGPSEKQERYHGHDYTTMEQCLSARSSMAFREGALTCEPTPVSGS